MKQASLPARLYLACIYLAGTAALLSGMEGIQLDEPWLLLVLCVLGSMALILKVEGSSSRLHYTFSFVVYGFTFATFGVSDAILVILVSHIAEWMWNKPPFWVQMFNISIYLVAAEVVGLVFFIVNQAGPLLAEKATLGIFIGMAAFTGLSQLLSTVFPNLTRGMNYKKPNSISLFPLILDIALLYFGASLAVIWKHEPVAIILLAIPAYILYSALRVPALERKTELDSKTGLYNQSYFKKQLEAELARSNRFDRPLSVIMADLDLLRNINNTYGHLAGDEVLIGVSKAMKQVVREYDVVARFGGEEFAILLPETTLMQAYEKAEVFRKTIEEMEFHIPTSSTPIRATMSFGVADRENSRQTSTEIVHNADLALYNSKLSGRNRTFAHANRTNLNLPPTDDSPINRSAGSGLSSQSLCALGGAMLPQSIE